MSQMRKVAKKKPANSENISSGPMRIEEELDSCPTNSNGNKYILLVCGRIKLWAVDKNCRR